MGTPIPPCILTTLAGSSGAEIASQALEEHLNGVFPCVVSLAEPHVFGPLMQPLRSRSRAPTGLEIVPVFTFSCTRCPPRTPRVMPALFYASPGSSHTHHPLSLFVFVSHLQPTPAGILFLYKKHCPAIRFLALDFS